MNDTDFGENKQGLNSSDYKINSGVINVVDPSTLSPIYNVRFETTLLS